MKPVFLILLLLSIPSALAIQFPEPAKDAKAGDILVKEGKVGAHAADFVTLSVPENWDNPSKLIHLPVLRIRSGTQGAAEPVFVFHGGPGGPNIQPQVSYERLLKNWDVVLVGYRGVDGSVSLAEPDCNKFLKTVADPLSAEGLKALGEVMTATAKRAQRNGIDLAQYNLDAMIRDIEAARKALGFGKIHTSGSSCGGAVAYYYCLSNPDHVDRNVMIEAAFPWNLGVAEPAGVDENLRLFGKMWNPDKDVGEMIRRVLATLPKQQKVTTPQGEVEVLIDPGTIKLMTFFSLYTAEQRSRTFDAFAAAEGGNYVPLAMVDLFWGQVVDFFNWGDLLAKTVSSRTGPDRDYEKEMQPKDSILGSPLTLLGWGSFKYAHWPVSPLKIQGFRSCRVETAMIYGNEAAARAPRAHLSTFEKARLVVLENLGHMDVSKEADLIQEAFLLKGLAGLPSRE